MIPDGTITLTWLNVPGGGITFNMAGRKRGEVADMAAVQTKAIVMQALAAFADAEFRMALREQEAALKAAEGLVQAN